MSLAAGGICAGAARGADRTARTTTHQIRRIHHTPGLIGNGKMARARRWRKGARLAEWVPERQGGGRSARLQSCHKPPEPETPYGTDGPGEEDPIDAEGRMAGDRCRADDYRRPVHRVH